MATVTKFQDFSEQLVKGLHNFGGADVFKMALVANANVPAATATLYSGITPIAAANGYAAGGPTVTITEAEAAGTTTITGNALTITAAGGAIATFRHYVLYNSTTGGLIMMWDHGSDVTLADGESFTIKFNNGAVTGTIATVV